MIKRKGKFEGYTGSAMNLSATRFSKYAWAVLAYNVFVILFGAFVRASGSGAGCGAHWPLCNGVVVPQAPAIHTVIEYTHRLTSGLTLIGVAVLFIWAWRIFKGRSLIRVSSAFAMLFIITEALIGAGLVLFRLVEYNNSIYRAVSMVAHLVNTFLLIASLTFTAWWSSTGVPDRLLIRGFAGTLLVVGGLAILLLGASGAITALGDTLFPSGSLAEGIQQDFSATAHYLIRIRIYHPAIAVSVGMYLAAVTLWVRRKFQAEYLERVTNLLFSLYGLQLFLGILNVALLAPVWMQIVHLLVSNLIWISFILMSAITFGGAQLSASVGDHPIHQTVGQVPE